MNQTDGSALEGTACKACGHAHADKFCPQCGHVARSTHRSLWAVFQDLLNSAIYGDFKTLRSVFALVLAPGTISLATRNNTGRHITPVKLFFAVLVFFTLFNAYTPIPYAQILNISNEEYGFADMANAPASGFQPVAVMFAPRQDSVLSTGVRTLIEDNSRDELLARDTTWQRVLDIHASQRTELSVMRTANTAMSYSPLLVIIPIFVINGLIYRRRRFLTDHVLAAFEAASLFLIVVILAQLVAQGLALFAPSSTAMREYFPFSGLFLQLVMPAYLLGLMALDRRFYKTGWLWLLPKALLVMLAYLFVMFFTMAQMLTFVQTGAFARVF